MATTTPADERAVFRAQIHALGARDVDPAEAAYQAALTRQAAILARPQVAAILERARTLTDKQRTALHAAWVAHFHTFRPAQSDLWHRFARAVPKQHWQDTLIVAEQIGTAARGGAGVNEGDNWGACHVLEDAAKAVIMGDLLSDAEALVYVGPYRQVLGELPAFVSSWAGEQS